MITILVLILLVTTGALFVALSLPTGFRKRLLALCRKKASNQEVLMMPLLLWVLLTMAACPWLVSSFANPLPRELHLTREFILTDVVASHRGSTLIVPSATEPMTVAVKRTALALTAVARSTPTPTLKSTSTPAPPLC